MTSRFSKIAFAALTLVSLTATTLWADPSGAGFAPDPPLHATAKHWVLRVDHDPSGPHLSTVRPLILDKPGATERMMGRFAIELFVGRELLDRIRFDIPLVGEGPPERDPKRPFRRPTFEQVTTHLDVRIADHPRATYLQLVDRATGVSQRFWWPPGPEQKLVPFGAEEAAAKAVDAGASDASVDAPVDAPVDGPSDAPND